MRIVAPEKFHFLASFKHIVLHGTSYITKLACMEILYSYAYNNPYFQEKWVYSRPLRKYCEIYKFSQALKEPILLSLTIEEGYDMKIQNFPWRSLFSSLPTWVTIYDSFCNLLEQGKADSDIQITNEKKIEHNASYGKYL